MRLKLCFLVLFALVTAQLEPVVLIAHAATGQQAGQQGRPFEMLVASIRNALSLDEKQVEELKKILAALAKIRGFFTCSTGRASGRAPATSSRSVRKG
ncbi:MAG TPA: hypothetical protein VFQ92_21220 [Blastocatellia bacterium]|nr:hypothetical protein [Blastocatellia bacterium]